MRSRRTWTVAAAAVLLLSVVSGCSDSPKALVGKGGDTPSASSTPKSDAEITASIPADATGVKVNRTLRLDVAHGTLSSVAVAGKSGQLEGTLSADKVSWQSTGRLQPGETYRVHGVAVDEDGKESDYRSRFTTQALGLDQQAFPSFFPLPDATVGVGMPAIIRFDVPITNKASIEKHLHVTSVPAQPGAFHWISDQEVHWRPEQYWQPGTKVTVDADIDSVPAGNGIFGQKSRTSTFTIGRSMVSKVNINTHQMRVFQDGKLIRTIPITTGEQPKYTTRSGVKVIVEKYRKKRMNSETVGIDPNGPDGYNIAGVEYAMRITYSGEFVHAAPWSVGSQGRANVSHGCTGMSTANAQWLYDQTLIGDVVEYTGSDKPMTLTNGIGDWNLPFQEYAAGSALS
ncbi:MAG: L,D-transpeptidase family protein [Propionibacteriales bacterium]|nr:L,D-transpeptidase family protein [Propionibacteriales bacterium]